MLRKISLILTTILCISNIPAIAISESIDNSPIPTELVEENLLNTTKKML